MYGNKLAAAIKVNGKVLREFKDTVHIPFGSEYTILIKNLHTQRAVVNVYIDGNNVVPNGLVLNPGQEVDLERSIVNNNLNEGNRFKFIERTGAVEQHRGIQIEDGLVRIEHQFEQLRPVVYDSCYSKDTIYPQGGIMRGTSADWTSISSRATYDSYSVNSSHELLNSYNDVGITVPGSRSDQKFTTTSMGLLEYEKYSMVIKLFGGKVAQPITVKHKPKCVTCGKLNKANAKFCSECGTALEIFA